MTPEQIQELNALLAPRPSSDLGGLEGVPNQAVTLGQPGPPALASYEPIPSHLQYQPQPPEPDSFAMRGLMDPVSDGGLGVAGRGALPDRPQRNRPEDVLARELFGPDVQLGFTDRLRLRQSMTDGGLVQLAGQRKQQALHLQQLEEQKRQHNWGVAEKLITSGNIEALDKFGDEFPPARIIAQAVSKQDLAELPTFVERGYIPQEFVQRFVNPKPGEKPPSVGELRSYVDMGKQMFKEDVKAEAKQRQLELALNTPQAQRRPSQQQLVDEHQAALDVKNADVDLKRAQAAKARMEAERGPADNSNLEKIHEMVSGGKPWRMGTPQTQQKALDEYARLMPEGRTNVMLGTPIPVEKRSNLIDRNEFLKHDKLVNPPQGATEGATRSGSYVEMTDRQREDWGNLVNSGATLQTLFDEVEPLVTATNSAQAAKQFARLHLEAATKKNPQAATYLADSEAFSSRMARVFGSEVGVLTNPDVERWRRALPTFGDTKQVLAEKKRIFMSIYKQTKDMYKKKIAGEDYSEDLVGLRRGPLKEVDKIAPPSVNDDFNAFFGGK